MKYIKEKNPRFNFTSQDNSVFQFGEFTFQTKYLVMATPHKMQDGSGEIQFEYKNERFRAQFLEYGTGYFFEQYQSLNNNAQKTFFPVN